MIKLKSILNEMYSSQTNITNLTPKVEKMIADLKNKYPNERITLTDNYKWLHRDNLKGTYTLGVGGDSSMPKNLKSDIDKIYKASK